MSGSPASWSLVKLGDISEFKYGKALPASVRDGGEFPVYGSNGIVGQHSTWLSVAPTIIIGRKGSVGEVCFSDKNCSPIDTTYYVDSFKFLEPKFCFYLLKTLRLGDLNKSTAIPGLNRQDAYDLEIGLPPLAEQTRIATKLDELLAQVDILKARIDGIPVLLKRFRQSVLASAVSGKLTEGWRALNPSVSPILPDELKKAWADTYQSDGRKYKEADLLPGSLGYPLPNSWVEAKVGEVFDVYVGATPSRASPKFWGEEIPWVSSSEVAFCRIKTTRESITEAGYKSASTTIHPAGTVMLAMIGQGKTRGQPAILDIKACHNQNTAALRVHSAYCISEYLYYYLYERYEETRRVGSGNNQQALNKKTVQSLPFPLPPRAEQIEIVRRIEQLFAFADQLEAGIKAAQVRIDLLTQSILAKAFRGDLVPQDPNDEPASVLLDRIKAQRAAAPKAKHGRRSATAG
jgi:type I restriction enzyme S subunit